VTLCTAHLPSQRAGGPHHQHRLLVDLSAADRLGNAINAAHWLVCGGCGVCCPGDQALAAAGARCERSMIVIIAGLSRRTAAGNLSSVLIQESVVLSCMHASCVPTTGFCFLHLVRTWAAASRRKSPALSAP
jgi:hypothetical protein